MKSNTCDGKCKIKLWNKSRKERRQYQTARFINSKTPLKKDYTTRRK